VENGRSTLDLRLALDQGPISGELALSGGPARPFTGYTGLIAVLESIRAELADCADLGTAEAVTESRSGRPE
jgi:hypothetical protein